MNCTLPSVRMFLNITCKKVDMPCPESLRDLPDAPATVPEQNTFKLPVDTIDSMEFTMEDDDRLECNDCDQRFDSMSGLIAHMRITHVRGGE